MKYIDFKRKIREFEALAAARPETYSRKLAVSILTGYLFVAFIAILGLAGLVLMALVMLHSKRIYAGEIKILIFLAIYEFVILKALFVKIPPPDGFEAGRKDFPALFKLVEEVGSASNAPHIHRIVIEGDFNAGVCQIPRFGLLGGHTNHLIIGYPLVSTMTPEQFKAVLAHELGHVSKSHSALSLRIFRIRQTWQSIAESCGQGIASIFVVPFAKWYLPRLNAITFVISRRHEYEADSFAAKIAGAGNMAMALTLLEIKTRQFADANSDIWETAKSSPDAPAGFMTRLVSDLKTPPTEDKLRKYLSKGRKRKTSIVDSHPCLDDRLSAIGQAIPPTTALEAATAISAADQYLGEEWGRKICGYFDEKWHAAFSAPWRQLHESHMKDVEKLQTIESAAGSMNDFDSRFEHAILVESVRGTDAALPLFSQIASEFPGHPLATFTLGRALVQAKEARPDEGIGLIRKSFSMDITLLSAGNQIIAEYLTEDGREEELEQIYGFEEENENRLKRANTEIASFTAKHKYIRHNADKATLDAIRAVLAKETKIREAFLVRKEIEGDGKSMPPSLLLLKTSFFSFVGAEYNAKIAERLSFVPFPLYVMTFSSAPSRLKRKISAVPESRIY